MSFRVIDVFYDSYIYCPWVTKQIAALGFCQKDIERRGPPYEIDKTPYQEICTLRRTTFLYYYCQTSYSYMQILRGHLLHQCAQPAQRKSRVSQRVAFPQGASLFFVASLQY